MVSSRIYAGLPLPPIHLKTFGPDPKSTILLAGFQAPGTRGRTLQQGAKDLKIHGDWVPINAEIAQLDMLSAHADSNELMRWLSGFRRAPRRVFIVHGEPEASETLRVRIERELGWPSVVPRQDHLRQIKKVPPPIGL